MFGRAGVDSAGVEWVCLLWSWVWTEDDASLLLLWRSMSECKLSLSVSMSSAPVCVIGAVVDGGAGWYVPVFTLVVLLTVDRHCVTDVAFFAFLVARVS